MHTQQNPGKADSTRTTGILPYIHQMTETLKGFSQGCSRNHVHGAYFVGDSHPDMEDALKVKAK